MEHAAILVVRQLDRALELVTIVCSYPARDKADVNLPEIARRLSVTITSHDRLQRGQPDPHLADDVDDIRGHAPGQRQQQSLDRRVRGNAVAVYPKGILRWMLGLEAQCLTRPPQADVRISHQRTSPVSGTPAISASV